MAQNEATILAALSSTRAALARVLTGLGTAGDFKLDGTAHTFTGAIEALTRREEMLVKQLNSIPHVEVGHVATSVDAFGNEYGEYYGEDV